MASRDLDHTVSSSALTSGQTHTPGPWEIVPSRVSKNHCIYSHEGYGIGEAWDLQGNPENAANARLIAAAPTMAEFIATKAAEGDPEAVQIMELIRGHA